MTDLDVILEATPTITTLEQLATVGNRKSDLTVALIRDELPTSTYSLLTPNDVKTLVDNNITVFMQHGFSESTAYSDMDYANVGVEFVDDFGMLCSMARILVKCQPFTVEQLELMKENQVLFSTQYIENVTNDYATMMKTKRMTAFGINMVNEADGRSKLMRILSETQSLDMKNVSISNFVLPLLMSLIFSPRLRFALQRDPALMNSVYCFEGTICNFEMAEHLRIPFCDIFSLCWDLN
ncbi:MAG: hypothetical protein MJZ39_04085 [Bacteroidales bacterium]|nr:hypothetical protein [Bacteroidales bacterium]